MKVNGSSSESIALLIDAENVSAAKIQVILAELSKYGVVNIRRAYGNWKKPHLEPWENVLHEYAIQPVQQFDQTKGKNAADMALLIDAMDVLYTKNVGIFCLVSSDCDFTPLVLRLRADGKQVIGFGGSKAPVSLVKSCTKFLNFDEEKKAEDVNKGGAAKNGQPKSDKKLIERLRSLVESEKAEDGWAELSRIASRVKEKGPLPVHSSGTSKLRKIFTVTGLFDLEERSKGKGNAVFVRERKSVNLGN